MADIVKLIYKGDTMSQGGGGGSSSPFEILELKSQTDLTGAQAILDSVLAGNYVVIKYTKTTAANGVTTFYHLGRTTDSAATFYVGRWNTGSGSVSGEVAGESTGYHITPTCLKINFSGTTVTTVESSPTGNEVFVPGYIE